MVIGVQRAARRHKNDLVHSGVIKANQHRRGRKQRADGIIVSQSGADGTSSTSTVAVSSRVAVR